MKQRGKKPSNDKWLSVALFGLIFFGFYFVFSTLNSPKSDDGEYDLASLERKVNMAVNKNLRGVYDKQQLRDLDIKTEKFKLSQKFSEDYKKRSRDWEPETSNVAELYEEDTSSTDVQSSSLSVEAQLRNQISAQKERAAEDRRSKQDYIRQYKENAKKDGWIVELNDNLEVISAVPVQN